MRGEDLYIKNIENSFRSIKMGKKPSETNIGFSLNKLKIINEGLYEDYLKKYKEILANRK